MTEEMILSTSDEAAKRMTVTGWVARDGCFYGDDERIARYAGCTHRPCEDCGEPCPKSRIRCERCSAKRKREKFAALPVVEWNEKDPICLYDGDEFFFDMDDLRYFCEEHDCQPSDLMLTDTKPQELREIDPYDLYVDDLPEDGDLPGEIEEAFKRLNEVIRQHRQPLSYWHAGTVQIRTQDFVPE